MMAFARTLAIITCGSLAACEYGPPAIANAAPDSSLDL
jgi:hypothetical protein